MVDHFGHNPGLAAVVLAFSSCSPRQSLIRDFGISQAEAQELDEMIVCGDVCCFDLEMDGVWKRLQEMLLQKAVGKW